MWRAILVLFPVLCWAECQQVGVPTLPRLQGMVVDAQDSPQAGLTVELLSVRADGSTGAVQTAVTTDKQGRFAFKRQKEAAYILQLKQGERKFDGVKVKQGSGVMKLADGMRNVVLEIGESSCPRLSLAP